MTEKNNTKNTLSQSIQTQYKNRYRRLISRRERENVKVQIPPVCKCCPNYRPEFKYRYCLFARCPYDKYRKVFRERLLARDPFSESKAVKKDV